MCVCVCVFEFIRLYVWIILGKHTHAYIYMYILDSERVRATDWSEAQQWAGVDCCAGTDPVPQAACLS